MCINCIPPTDYEILKGIMEIYATKSLSHQFKTVGNSSGFTTVCTRIMPESLYESVT